MANTDQSGNHTGESSESARIVVANGQDIDKQYYHEVAKRMARDWDLRKLAYLGPPLWAVLSIGVVLWAGKTLFTRLRELFGNVLHTATVIGSGGIIGKSPQIITDYAPHILAGAVLLLFVIIPLFLVIKRFSSEGASSFDLLKLLVGSLKLFNPGIWQKSNYWNPFTSHLSDRDPLVVLAHQTDAQVSGIYSDEPHYGNVFVDSVFVTIEGDLNPVQRFRSRLLLGLYDYRLRWARRGLFALFGGIVFLWGVDPMVEMTTTPFDQIIPWKELTIMSVLLGVTMLVLLTLTRYPLFLVRFFAESAGLSRYKRLLNKPDTLTPTTNERTGPGNSLSGYGLFFVSEFLYSLFGYVRYDVSVNESYLLPSGDRSDERSDGAGSDTVNEGDGEAERTAETDSEYADSAPGEEQTTKSDGDDEDSPFPPLGIDDPNEAHATVAARELLWSAVPRDSVRAGGADADVSIMINGVDYYTINDEYIRRLGRLKLRLAKLRGKDVTVESERALERTHAGEKIGFRLPVKKFMSVPHGFPTEKINEPPGSEPDLYLFDDPDAGDLQWEEDTIHYLLLGGGEHQQGINKLILSMKAAGYENVDVLENAFASVTPFEESASQDGVVDWTWDASASPENRSTQTDSRRQTSSRLSTSSPVSLAGLGSSGRRIMRSSSFATS